MTFDELNKKLGSEEKSGDWRQAKGGGWLHKSAKVENEDKVTENAIVWGALSGDAQVSGDARVSGNARVSGDAQVSGNARVSGDAQVSGDARVSGNARVSGDAQVSGDAWVYGDARVSGDAWVYGDAWEKSPLFIIGSRFSLTNAKKGHIAIGCECHPFQWWKDKGLELAKEYNFTKAEIAEYTAYIELFCLVGK